MHIVQILPELNQGGVETIVLNLSRELVAHGHESTVISAGGPLSDQIKKGGAAHINLDVCSKNPLTVPFRVRALRKCLIKLDADLVHVHSRVPAWLTWLANRPLKLPFITTVHGFNSVSKYSKIMTKGDQVICVSNPVKDYIVQHYSPAGEKLHVIHCGIALEHFSPDIIDQTKLNAFKKEWNLQDRFVVSSIGRITELKDYETFIKAIAEAAKKKPELVGLIVGNVREDKKEYYTRLKQLVSDLQMGEHIRFITGGAPMPELYTLSDLVVSCSKKPESFGLTLIEALAMNTPVIATRHGGPLDIIKGGQNGFFFPVGNATELARLIDCHDLEMTDLRADMEHRFSLNKMVDSTLALYIASARHD